MKYKGNKGITLISLILTVSIVIAYNGIRLGMEYLGIGKNSNEITFNVPAGATSDQVITLLQENDIIKEAQEKESQEISFQQFGFRRSYHYFSYSYSFYRYSL